MKKVKCQDVEDENSSFNCLDTSICPKNLSFFYLFLILSIISIVIINDFILISLLKDKAEKINSYDKKRNENIPLIKSNINVSDEFFQIPEVQEQIYKNKLTFIKTLSGGKGMLGNALIILNNLINICIKIRCQNVITPEGLKAIIKKPIFYKDYYITILPESYKNKTKIDIELKTKTIFNFNYKGENQENRLAILREEIIHNIPKYMINPKDLYIHIRSGDIFLYPIFPNYAQPPLCFYQKIIIEQYFRQIYIFSNGFENPVIMKLLKLYPKIKYINTSLEDAVSIIINAYNFVISASTFSKTLIHLNINLKNLYIYSISNFKIKNITKEVIERYFR